MSNTELSHCEQQAAFMDAMGQPRFDWRAMIVGDLSAAQYTDLQSALKLADKLVHEEVVRELMPALFEFRASPRIDTLAEVLDAIVDSVYVLYQLANTLKLPFDEAFAEVHRSNMAKRGADGKVVFRDDGKVLKPEGWKPPQLEQFLRDKITEYLASPRA